MCYYGYCSWMGIHIASRFADLDKDGREICKASTKSVFCHMQAQTNIPFAML